MSLGFWSRPSLLLSWIPLDELHYASSELLKPNTVADWDVTHTHTLTVHHCIHSSPFTDRCKLAVYGFSGHLGSYVNLWIRSTSPPLFSIRRMFAIRPLHSRWNPDCFHFVSTLGTKKNPTAHDRFPHLFSQNSLFGLSVEEGRSDSQSVTREARAKI